VILGRRISLRLSSKVPSPALPSETMRRRTEVWRKQQQRAVKILLLATFQQWVKKHHRPSLPTIVLSPSGGQVEPNAWTPPPQHHHKTKIKRPSKPFGPISR
jgi:hypothetical protein